MIYIYFFKNLIIFHLIQKDLYKNIKLSNRNSY